MNSAAVVITLVAGLCASAVDSAPSSPPQMEGKDPRFLAISRPKLVEDVITYAPKPYQFGYELEDGLGMSQYRSEVSDGTGVVKGSYGYMDPVGVYRKVEYTADNNGYRAVVRSNEPGTANQNVADALFIVEPPPVAAINQGLHSEISPRDSKLS